MKLKVADPTLPHVLLSILLLGASAIHFLESRGHFEEDQLYGWFFLAVGALQMVASVLVVTWRKTVVYVLTAAASAGLLMLWVLTHTVGIPLGEAAGRIEVVRAADLTAAVFETLTLILCLVWLRLLLNPGAASARRTTLGKSILLASTLVVSGGVAYAAVADREACSHFDPRYGPLAAIDGHSLLPRTTPASFLNVGEEKDVLAGFLVNCARSHVVVDRVDILTSAGEAALVESIDLRPQRIEFGRAAQDVRAHAAWVVPPTDRHPELAVFARLTGIRNGSFFINGLRISFHHRGASRSQVFATNVAVHVQQK